mgnify:CR=1 FL=1
MPSTVSITVRYQNGDIENFAGCTIASDPTISGDWLIFTGELSGDGASKTHKIKWAPGMRMTIS